MRIKCPICHSPISKEEIDPSGNIAFCANCQRSFDIPNLAVTQEKESFYTAFREIIDEMPIEITNNPPKGTWLKQKADSVVVGASMYSTINLIISLSMILSAIIMICILFGGFVNAGDIITKYIFGIVGIVVLIAGVACIITGSFFGFGKVEVVIGEKSYLSKSIGKLGIKKRFNWNAVNSIYIKTIENISSGSEPGAAETQIYIDSINKRLKFGDHLDSDKRNYIFNILNYLCFMHVREDMFTREACEEYSVEAITKYKPRGAWFKQKADRLVIGASTRRWSAIFFLFFTAFWIGFLVFVTIGIATGFIGFDGNYSTIILFSVPFWLVGIFLLIKTLMLLVGKLEAVIGSNSYLFTGVWKLGIKRKFDWGAVKSIQIKAFTYSDADDHIHSSTYIIFEGTGIKFGNQLSDKRRDFMMEVLCHIHADRISGARG